MVVCICNNINEKNLQQVIKNKKIKSLKQIQEYGVCNCCKKCCKEVKQIIDEQNLYEES